MSGLELDETLFWSDWKRSRPPRTIAWDDGEPFEYRPRSIGRLTNGFLNEIVARSISSFEIRWADTLCGRSQARRAMPTDFIDTGSPMTLNIIVHLLGGDTVEISTEVKELQYIGPDIAHALVERGIEVYERIEVVVEKAL